MNKKELLRMAKRKKVTFLIQADCAKSVQVLGDFNEWDLQIKPMKLEGDGNWVAQVVLPQGRYEYKFLIDGQWVNDPLNNHVCQNSFGTHNNILEVALK